MATTRRLHLLLVLLLIQLFLSGCGKRSEPLTPVHGKVLFRNEPLRGGTIVFTPDADRGTTGPMARGEIKPDGTYVLTTGPEDGCVAGWHRITIMATEPANQGVPMSLPRRYCDPEMSGLLREVKRGENNDINLELN